MCFSVGNENKEKTVMNVAENREISMPSFDMLNFFEINQNNFIFPVNTNIKTFCTKHYSPFEYLPPLLI